MIISALSEKISGITSRLQVANHVTRSIEWECGEKFINLPAGEVVVILLCRNMAHYLDGFYDYYKSIGVNYFVYTDNGSNDNSIEIVSKWKNAVVLSTDLNFRKYQSYIRQIISVKYCSDGWRLAVDPDELFDSIGMENLSIQEFAKSLLDDGYTGLVAQMLDLVSGKSLIEGARESFSDTIKFSKYYSLENITDYHYFSQRIPFAGLVKNNTVANSETYWKFGGIRKMYFDENCCLTKHPLFYYKRGVKPFRHPHLTTGLKLADFTSVLKHYKFSGDYLSRERDLLDQKRISHDETEKRASIIEDGTNFRFNTANLYSDPSPVDLSERGFLVMTERAKKRYL